MDFIAMLLLPHADAINHELLFSSYNIKNMYEPTP